MANLLKTPITSSKRKSVFLREWWLIKVQGGSKLGVGGFVNRETRGMQLLRSASAGKRHSINTIENGIQVYGSAAIAKRHDNNTLEAVDGIIIQISGCINRLRTLTYGFSSEVCDVFLTGFPCNWEDYASKSSHDECDNGTTKSCHVSFDDLPVTHVRDLLMSETDSLALTSIIFKDIAKHTEMLLTQSIPSVEKTSTHSRETEVNHNQDDDVCFPDSTQKITVEDCKIPVGSHMKKPEETEVDHKRDDICLSNPTQKIAEEDCKTPLDSHRKKSEETEDGGFRSNEVHKITKEKQSKARRYPLRSTRKRSIAEVD